MSDKLEIKITGSNQASSVFKQVTHDAQSMGNSIEQSGRRAGMSLDEVNRRAVAMGAAIGTTASILADWSRGAAEDAAGQERLEQAVENTGKAYVQYSASIDRAIAAGQKKAFGDDQTREALVRLNSVTNDTQESLNQLGLVMDFARARGISLSQSADIIAKVMGGNIGILSRYGIALEEGATSTEALAKIQQISAGQAERYANTTAGSVDRLRDKWGEFTETVGGSTGVLQEALVLLPGLSAGFTLLSGAVGGLAGALGGIGGAAAGTTAVAGELTATASGATLLGGSLATAGVAAAAFVPALALVGYTAYTAKDNIEAVTQRTDALTESLKRVNDAAIAAGTAVGGTANTPGVDEFATRLYGMVSQYSSNVEYTDEFGKTYSLESVFDDLTQLKGVYQDAFLDMARSANISFTQPTEDNIRFLIDQILYYRRLQQQVMNEQEQTDFQAMGNPTWNLSTTAGGRYYGDVGSSGYNGPYQPRMSSTLPTQLYPMYTGPFQPATDPNKGRYYGDVKTPPTTAYIDLPTQLDAQSGVQSSMASMQAGSVNQLNQTNAALEKQLGIWYDLKDGIQSTSEVQTAWSLVNQTVISQQQVYGGQISEYTQQQNALTDARDVLLQRQQEGVKLTSEEQALLDNYPALYERVSGGVEDATVAQGLLAMQYIENMKMGDQLNESMKGQTDAVGGLTRVIEEMILQMDGVPTEVKTQILLENSDESIEDLIRYQSWLNSIPGYVQTVVDTVFVESGTGAGGRTRGANRLGGVVGYRNGGIPVELAEAGPELLHFRDGGSAWAMNRGRYSVPPGTYVDTAPASKLKAAAPSSGGGITITGPVYIYPATGDVEREFTSAMVGDWRRS